MRPHVGDRINEIREGKGDGKNVSRRRNALRIAASVAFFLIIAVAFFSFSGDHTNENESNGAYMLAEAEDGETTGISSVPIVTDNVARNAVDPADSSGNGSGSDMLIWLLIAALAAFVLFILFTLTRKCDVTGIVTSRGSSLGGVSIIYKVKGKEMVATTDAEGRYQIKAAKGTDVAVTSVVKEGYKTVKTLPLNIIMMKDMADLNFKLEAQKGRSGK
ncbi:MAG: carboxypeptidase-like regulatory domain-containing protein [Methanomassiliicoccaceae archaeon]|nr:carboxypeptidase-like regulatory domain-containing protein [Methanomassiliicoccaceae archaeon]